MKKLELKQIIKEIVGEMEEVEVFSDCCGQQPKREVETRKDSSGNLVGVCSRCGNWTNFTPDEGQSLNEAERSLPVSMLVGGKIESYSVDTGSGNTRVIYFIVKGSQRYSLSTSDGVIKKLAF
jgi:hypothetical protein